MVAELWKLDLLLWIAFSGVWDLDRLNLEVEREDIERRVRRAVALPTDLETVLAILCVDCFNMFSVENFELCVCAMCATKYLKFV